MQELIKNFDFNGHGVRIITNENNDVFFVAKDVCDILGYSNTSKAISDNCKKECITTGYIPHPQSETKQIEVTFINESNLYRLVMRSKKKEAIDFQDWVCDEVLPSIRKTGKYEKTVVAISIEDVLIQQLQITKSVRIEQEQIKVRQSEQDERILQIEAKNATSPDYFTIMGYAILKKKKVNVTLAAEIGRKSTAICKQKGYPVEKVRDPRFGYVGSYPTEVLQTVFSAMSFT